MSQFTFPIDDQGQNLIFKKIFETSPNGIIILDSKGIIVEQNKSISDIFGVKLSANVNLLEHPSFKDNGISDQIHKMVQGESLYFSDIWLDLKKIENNPKKENICLAIIAFKVENLYIFELQDVTVINNFQDTIHNTEKIYKKIYEQAADVIFSISLSNGKISSINGAGLKLIGYSIDEIIGMSYKDLIATDSAVLIDDLISRSDKVELGNNYHEIIIYTKAKEHLLGEINLQFLYHDSKPIEVLGFLRNISSKFYKMEESYTRDKLESIGTLAAGIAHDFNNILAALLGNVSLALEEDDIDVIKSILIETESNIVRAKNITHQLLTFAKGGKPIKKKDSITSLISNVAVSVLAGSKSKCHLVFDEKMWPCNIDSEQMMHAIGNIIINADQSMPNGGNINISFHNVDLFKDPKHFQFLKRKTNINKGKYIEISITDEGNGIPLKYQSRIFDPYFTTKKKGSGLGLTSSISIIKKHQGYLFFETDFSEDNHGTTFYILIPIEDDKKIAQKAPKETFLEEHKKIIPNDKISLPIHKEIQKKAIKSSKIKKPEINITNRDQQILILEDDPSISKILSKMLKRLNYIPVITEEGKDTVEEYIRSLEMNAKYKLLIMDLTIPGAMGGKEAIEILKEIDPDIRAIVSSGYSNDPVMANPTEYGFIDFLKKPFTLTELKDILIKSFK